MHILMLAQFYAPVIGGEERHVQDLCIELVKRVLIKVQAKISKPNDSNSAISGSHPHLLRVVLV